MLYCTSCGNEILDDALFCSKCGKPISNTAGITRKRSKRWYLLPIFFDIIGGIICYYALRNDDKKLAQNCLKLGVILFLVNIAIGITVGVYEEFEHEKNNQVSIVIGAGASASADCVAANNCYSPNQLTVSPGTTVTWTNNDKLSHTITSGKVSDNDAGSMFDSGLVKSGKTFQFTFANTGTINYFCTVHPWMTGQVIVE